MRTLGPALVALLLAGSAPAAPLPRTATTVSGMDSPDGRVTKARLSGTKAFHVYPDGAIVFVDLGYSTVRRFDPLAKTITTIAGDGQRGLLDGRAAESRFATPHALAVDGRGMIYVSDFANHTVRAFNPNRQALSAAGIRVAAGRVATIAGVGKPGFSGDGGPATLAELEFPRGIGVSDSGTVYVSDIHNHRVRSIAPNGTMGTAAGNGDCVAPGSGLDNGDGGPATEAALCFPSEILLDPAGGFYVGEWTYSVDGVEAGRIRHVDAAGIITTVAGTGLAPEGGDGGPALDAGLAGNPGNMGLDAAGNLYFGDGWNGTVRRIDHETGIITKVVGIGGFPGAGWDAADEGGPALDAHFADTSGMQLVDGVLYVSDVQTGRIKVVSPGADGQILGRDEETIHDLAGNGPGIRQPYSMATGPCGPVAGANWDGRAWAIAPDGAQDLLVNESGVYGTAGVGGPARLAQLGFINDVAFDEAGNLFLYDFGFGRVVELEAGADGCVSAASTLLNVADIPDGTDRMAVGDGFIWYIPLDSNFVRRINVLTGEDTLVAGVEDGDSDAALQGPRDLFYDPAHHQLYVSESPAGRVRRIDTRTLTIEPVVQVCQPFECWPEFLAVADDWLYILDSGARVLRQDLRDLGSPPEPVWGYLGSWDEGWTGDGVSGTTNDVDVSALDVGRRNGKLYIASRVSERIRRLGVVDILPGSYPNVVDLTSSEPIQVAILGTYQLAAATIDPKTVRVGAASPVGDSFLADVDEDGRDDLVVGVRPTELALAPDSREVVVTAWAQGLTITDADFIESGVVEPQPDAGVPDAPPPPSPDAAIASPDAAEPEAPDAAVPSPDAAIPSPDAAIPSPDAAIPSPDAAIPSPDAAIPSPDATVAKDAAPATPDAAAPKPDAATQMAAEGSGGCGCRTAPIGGGDRASGILTALALAFVVRRRRRRATRSSR